MFVSTLVVLLLGLALRFGVSGVACGPLRSRLWTQQALLK